MGRKKKVAVVVEAPGVTIEQHLKDIRLLGAAPVETPVETPVEEDLIEVTLFDATPVQVNGQLQRLPGGKQKVTRHIYNILRDANLTN